MASITVKTPSRTWTLEQGVLYKDVIGKHIQRNASKIVLNKIAELNSKGSNYRAVINQRLSIYATFFQRVVSRTPLDESYTVTIFDEKKGIEKTVHHTKDDIQCRYDWYMSDGEVELSARAFPKAYFKDVNDKKAIEGIKKKLQEIYAKNLSKKNSEEIIKKIERLEVFNNNPHFAVLEYGGGYHWGDKSEIKKGPGNKYEHGVENKHSVQAPVGMKRISELELQRESEKASRTNLTTRYKGNGTKKLARVPSDKELEEFWKMLSKKRIKFADIKRYIGAR